MKILTLCTVIVLVASSSTPDVQSAQDLKGTTWTRTTNFGAADSLKFISEKDVQFYMNELDWTFNSTYSLNGNKCLVLTKLAELEVEFTEQLKPTLKQEYELEGGFLRPTSTERFRSGQWTKVPTDGMRSFKIEQ